MTFLLAYLIGVAVSAWVATRAILGFTATLEYTYVRKGVRMYWGDVGMVVFMALCSWIGVLATLISMGSYVFPGDPKDESRFRDGRRVALWVSEADDKT